MFYDMRKFGGGGGRRLFVFSGTRAGVWKLVVGEYGDFENESVRRGRVGHSFLLVKMGSIL